MDALNPEHVEWCRKTFAVIADGGAWGVPRSGLIFTKRGDKFVLTMVMPHDPAMPITAAQLREQQVSDYEGSVIHFGAAGITVQDATGLMP